MLKTVSSITNAIGALNYKGTWNAATNTPDLDALGAQKGDYYVVSVAGSTSLGGISTWNVGDWAVYNGAVWQRVEGGEDDPAPSVRSNTTTGVMEITGPAAASTRVMTVPDADFTVLTTTDIGTTVQGFDANTAKLNVAQTFTQPQTFRQTSAATVRRDRGNVVQGFYEANRYVYLRHLAPTSLGTKLIIPFVSQGSAWTQTLVRVMGVANTVSGDNPIAFTAHFALRHLSSMADLSAFNTGGNYASIAINGMNVEITFTTAYTFGTNPGVQIFLEYMTGFAARSIDVANISLN